MMDGLRKASETWTGRIILSALMLLIVLSFGIFGIGDIFRGFNANKVATVGDTEITAEAFRAAYQQDLSDVQRQARRAITNDQMRMMGRDQLVLGKLIAEAALDQKAKSLGLAMSDAEIARLIQEDPTFRGTNGRFDRAAFNAMIRNGGYTEQSFVRAQRSVYLRQEIAQAVTSNLKPPLAAMEAINRFRAETRAVEYFLIPADAPAAIAAPSDEVLQSYFDARKQTFRAPEFRKIVYLALSPEALAQKIVVSDADAMAIYTRDKAKYSSEESRTIEQISFPDMAAAEAASVKIKSGTPFAAIAAEQKVSAAELEIGDLKRGDVAEKAVGDAAYALPEGGVSSPIKTTIGAVIVRIAKITPVTIKPFDVVSTDIKADLAASRTRDLLQAARDKVEDQRASGKPLSEAAKAAGLDVTTIEAVSADGRDKEGKEIPGLPEREALLGAAFTSGVGYDNETLNTRDGATLWYEVLAIEPAHDRGIADVHDAVLASWRDDEANKRLVAKAGDFVKQIDDGAAIEKVAADEKFELKSNTSVKRNGGEGLSQAAVTAIFNVAVGKAGSATAGPEGGRLVFRVNDSAVPPFDANAEDVKAMTDQFKSILTEDLFAQYLTQLQNEAGVSVNQAAFRAATGTDP